MPSRAPAQEIVYYSAGHDAYLVLHENGLRFWFKEALVEEHLLNDWAEYRLKRKREDEQEAKLSEMQLESVSQAPRSIIFGNSPPHNKALLMDGFLTMKDKDGKYQGKKARERFANPDVYERYTEKAKLNGHNVPLLASQMPGIVINTRERIPKGGRDPPVEVQQAIQEAINKAFESLPFEERPENKKSNPDDFGQHKCNFEDKTHNFSTNPSYDRLYLQTAPKKADGKRPRVRCAARAHAHAPSLALLNLTTISTCQV